MPIAKRAYLYLTIQKAQNPLYKNKQRERLYNLWKNSSIQNAEGYYWKLRK